MCRTLYWVILLGHGEQAFVRLQNLYSCKERVKRKYSVEEEYYMFCFTQLGKSLDLLTPKPAAS